VRVEDFVDVISGCPPDRVDQLIRALVPVISFGLIIPNDFFRQILQTTHYAVFVGLAMGVARTPDAVRPSSNPISAKFVCTVPAIAAITASKVRRDVLFDACMFAAVSAIISFEKSGSMLSPF